MQAVIMAGGYGTRLQKLTHDVIPKPMIEICGKPLLQWQIENLKPQTFLRQDLALYSSFVANSPLRRNNLKKIWCDYLESA